MAATPGNPLKKILRRTIKNKLNSMPAESKQIQSKTIANKILVSDVFKNSERVSIYLSMNDYEVSTLPILEEMFRQRKKVYVPTYLGNRMEMVRLNDIPDYDTLQRTGWNIKQPNFNEERENALRTGGLDLFLMPGVAFSRNGGRCGHGMGFYDKYLQRHFNMYPERQCTNRSMNIYDKLLQRKTILIGLAFQEQIVENDALPLDEHDYLLDWILTCD